MDDDDLLELLDLRALEQVRAERRRIVALAAELASKEPAESIQRRWELDRAQRALRAVEAEISKRSDVL